MLRKLPYLALTVCFCSGAFAQSGLSAQDDSLTNDSAQQRPAPQPFVFKPTIGLGTGMFSYFGDLYAKHFISPQVSRVGYEMSIGQELTPYLRLNFYTLFGKLGANERLITRNLNFESEIRVGGVHLEYNFSHLLKDSAKVLPFVTAGFESFEFLSKTDLFDAAGNKYFYWSDGSIRNMDENDPNAAFSSLLQRDYVYESDVREQNLDGFGKYPERSWSVPVGAGVLFKLTDNWDAKVGATMHFALTDYVDGVTEKSLGVRQGDARNDHFMMTSVTLRYTLSGPRKTLDSTGRDIYEDVDWYALDKADYDKDGVIDLKDSCGGTPPGVEVDARGCPVDSDNDLVPDYRDDELPSPGTLVNERGVFLSDSLIQLAYEMYMDSTGKFAKTVILKSGGQPYTGPARRTYAVSVGTYKNGLPNELMTKFLSIGDISSTVLPDSSVIYTVGQYEDLRAAEKRKRTLLQQGISVAAVVYKAPDGTYKEVTGVFNTTDPKDPIAGDPKDPKDPKDPVIGDPKDPKDPVIGDPKDPGVLPADGKLVFRVQLGAFRKRLSKNVFADVPDLIEVKGDDGIYRYLTGSFSTFDDAAGHKVNMLVKGYKGAFIVAYKNGKRVALTDAGAEIAKPMPPDSMTSSGNVSKTLVAFKVQLGVFKNEPPAEVQAKLNAISGVERTITSSGLSRYTVGTTNNYEQITNLKREMREKGFPDAFVLAFFKGEPITIQEALELLK